MMTCCTFVYSVINLTWFKQYMFLILVHSDFLGIPLPTPCILHKSKTFETNKLKPRYLYLFKQTEGYYSEVNRTQEKTMNNNKNWQLCYFCKRYNHQQEECCTQDSREPTLHRQQRVKILAEKIHHKWGDNPEHNFPHLSTDKLHDTTERKLSGTTIVTAKSLSGLIGYPQ